MRQVPTRCPSCGEQNIHNLDYCSICGKSFTSRTSKPVRSKPRKMSPKEKKINAKRLKKRRELTELYKRKKISTQQYAAGLRKLGYSTNVEKALAFKNYIQDQIVAMENMQVDPNAREGDIYYDPNQANIDLPRDADGNVIVDFTVTTGEKKSSQRKPTESMPIVDHGSLQQSRDGPRFGHSLFGNRELREEKRVVDRVRKRETPRMLKDDPVRKKGPARKRALADWDDEEDEGEEEDDFSIDLEEEGGKGESGWWDDDDWELEWTEEDEEDFNDWNIEYEDDEEDGWVLEFEEDDEEFEEEHHEVSFDDDVEFDIEDEDDDEEFDYPGPDNDEVEFQIEEDEDEDDDEEDTDTDEDEFEIDDEDDEEDWGISKGRRRMQKR